MPTFIDGRLQGRCAPRVSTDQADRRISPVRPPLDPGVEQALRSVATSAEAAIAGCDGVAVTMAWQGVPTGVVFSSEAVEEVDSVQYENGVGPCLDAIRQLQVFRVDFLPEAQSWPDFAEAAGRRGMFSSLSVPLIAGGEVWGALNLYSRTRDAFKGSEHAAIDVATEVERALTAHGHRTSRDRRPDSSQAGNR